MQPETAFKFINDTAVVVGMRGDFPPVTALHITETLIDEGFNVFEFMMNSTDPIAAMQAVKKQFGDHACVGMGTVLTLDDAKRVLDAGADFIVSPVFQPDIVEFVRDSDVLVAPGVITPTEARDAWAMDVKLLKLFPIGALGVDYFKAMFGPLKHMKFMCNGAITADNTHDFIKAGAVAAGIGGWLVGDGSWSETRLRSRARILKNSVQLARETIPADINA
ncbi:MAG: bifunctional 4-hydroxy-2-oxoglutarate aldolase/2-dehydro-3-deoxy-phosphogluconate aldolase [Aggregatilineales bacterium]